MWEAIVPAREAETVLDSVVIGRALEATGPRRSPAILAATALVATALVATALVAIAPASAATGPRRCPVILAT